MNAFSTIIGKLDGVNDRAIIVKAAEIIRKGGLVAFPTETVYGIGANALNRDAVARIYEAKGRPSNNPLIVHIAEKEDVNTLAEKQNISKTAEKLMQAFWPGPLTLIFKKKVIVPDITSGGLDTVAVRLPNNHTARQLVRLSGTPIAAPSANFSGKPSSTLAEHVINDLNGKIDMIIDGNGNGTWNGIYAGSECEIGLESTIVDVSKDADTIALLRPGAVTVEMLSLFAENILDKTGMASDKPEAPGMMYRHYSPDAELTVVCGGVHKKAEHLREMYETAVSDGKKPGLLICEQLAGFFSREELANAFIIGDVEKPETIAANLYSLLRKFDQAGYTHILAEGYDGAGILQSVMNRLGKAGTVIKVF